MNIHEALNIISGYIDTCILIKPADKELERELKELEQAEEIVYKFVEKHTRPKVKKSKLTSKSVSQKCEKVNHKFALKRAASDIRHIERAIKWSAFWGKCNAEYTRTIWFNRWGNSESRRLVEEYFKDKGFQISFSFQNRYSSREYWNIWWH